MAQRIPLPDGLGQVKFAVRQVGFAKFSFKAYVICIEKCQILEVRQVKILDTSSTVFIGLGNGLFPARQLAIAWTNDD